MCVCACCPCIVSAHLQENLRDESCRVEPSVVHLTLDGVNGKERRRRNLLTVKIVDYAVNRQILVTVTPLFTVPFLNDAVCAQHW